ncbi:MAG: glycosyl hydrolase-related protein, partial [Clostridia bacterium]|nr:glycosyl hydrolase-related protein [Clostridia bacterium]
SFCAIQNDLRMTIARSCAFLDHFGQEHRDNEMQFIDKGEQEFNFILVPHTEKINSQLFKAGELLNTPLEVTQETHHDGSLPPVYSAISVDKENVVVTSVKSAEDGNGIVMRIIETNGEKTDCEIDFKAVDKKFSLSFNPQEIKTVRIPTDGNICEVKITEF